jgi:hypothetical protein
LTLASELLIKIQVNNIFPVPHFGGYQKEKSQWITPQERREALSSPSLDTENIVHKTVIQRLFLLAVVNMGTHIRGPAGCCSEANCRQAPRSRAGQYNSPELLQDRISQPKTATHH